MRTSRRSNQLAMLNLADSLRLMFGAAPTNRRVSSLFSKLLDACRWRVLNVEVYHSAELQVGGGRALNKLCATAVSVVLDPVESTIRFGESSQRSLNGPALLYLTQMIDGACAAASLAYGEELRVDGLLLLNKLDRVANVTRLHLGVRVTRAKEG